jgi:hypothetical protein
VHWRVLWAFVGVIALIALAIVVTIVVTTHRAVPEYDGPALSRAAREDIAHADCRRLSTLEAHYTPNGDSEEPDITGLRLTTQRQLELGC